MSCSVIPLSRNLLRVGRLALPLPREAKVRRSWVVRSQAFYLSLVPIFTQCFALHIAL